MGILQKNEVLVFVYKSENLELAGALAGNLTSLTPAALVPAQYALQVCFVLGAGGK